jgi:hypothetical protein
VPVDAAVAAFEEGGDFFFQDVAHRAGGGVGRGAATFNGRPLVTGTRTTFLFRTLGSN